MKPVALISKEEEGIYSGAKLELPRRGKHGYMCPRKSSLMFHRSRTTEVLKQGKKTLHWWKHQRGSSSKMGDSCRPQMYLMTCLAFVLVELSHQLS